MHEQIFEIRILISESVFRMRSILHVDMNNFYASVECLYRPEIRNHPVAVAGDPLNRHGIILAKNMIAKKLGVTTGEAIWEAKRKAPGLVLVPPDYKKYLHFSRMAREIYYEYSDQVEAFGLDENWIDLTQSLPYLHSDPVSVANTIRRRVKEELGVTVSVGVSFNKIFAKLGSDLKKPDATTVIPYERFREIVWPLPVGDLLYVGRSTARKLELIAVNTIGDLARTDVAVLRRRLGSGARSSGCSPMAWTPLRCGRSAKASRSKASATAPPVPGICRRSRTCGWCLPCWRNPWQRGCGTAA